MEPLTLVAWSDYLCPWCYNASVRLHRLEDESGGRVRIEWRSYLLRPNPSSRRDPERFRAYTESWLRPSAEEDSGDFRVWSGDAGPPSHSVPAHQVAKAAAGYGVEPFRRMHDRLLRAYFGENRDISAADTLRELWSEVGLPDAGFAKREEPAILERILDEHAEALEGGATGVPAVRMEGNDAIIVGAHPLELYQRWVRRTLAAREEASGAA
ncbi:MAG: DsbA family protein [Myxococcota bacterium]|nr:DsbA family protein [Myxococcota bacterium]